MAVIATPWRGPNGEQVCNPDGVDITTPRALLPAHLPSVVQQHHAALEDDVAPQTHLERIVIRQIARHAGALDVADVCEASILRRGECRAAIGPPRGTW
jgi:hypothetical protein